MKLLRIFAMAALVVNASLVVGFAAEAVPAPRFNVDFIDNTVSPRADFARFASGNWQKQNPIPADKARWGSFGELDRYNSAALRALVEAAAAESHAPGSVEQKVGDFFAAAMDTAAIEAAGLDPIRPELERIAAVVSPDDLARVAARLHAQGVGAFFAIAVGPDDKDSAVNALQVWQGGLSLPSKGYYFDESFSAVRAKFVEHVAALLALAGDDEASAKAGANTVFEVERSLAEKARTPVELRDPIANYNKMPVAELAAKAPAFPLSVYLEERGLGGAAKGEIIVGQPEFFEGLQAQLAARPLADWRVYLRYHALRAAAPFLASRFDEEVFRFYGTALRGTPAMEPRWQRVVRVIDDNLGEALGRLYVAKYYPPEAKSRMDELVRNVVAVMRDHLGRVDWMTAETRDKAVAKFERFYAKIGYPENWKDYAPLEIRRDASYFENARAAALFEDRREIAKLGKPVDKAEWHMSPPTINAYFDPTANNINFPAGILQPPFFDFTLDDAVNYGAIGAIIGHEITHGFDDQGRQYDADGNLKDWWTPADAEAFKARAQRMVEQFNAYEVLPGVKVNGELTLGENIADLGGVVLAYEALQRSLVGKERKLVDGYTAEQRFFLSWAQTWRTNAREAALRQQVAVDPHSPGQIRAIGPLVNFDPFYEAFGIKEGDPMWVAPEKRVRIW